ncbi:MAG: CoA transferase [Porticoccaceae bacterium]
MSQTIKTLGDLTVVDLGVGMAAALVSKYLVEQGARVIRVEPAGGDPFFELYPAYEVWRRGTVTDAAASQSADKLNELLAQADVCVTGGEDHPALTRRTDSAQLAKANPRLVVLDIEGYPAGAAKPATDLLVQARAGLTWEHFTDRPVPMSFSPANYGAALRGLCALFAALYERENSGLGQQVCTSLFEGALTWVVSLWLDVEKPTPATQFVMPKDPYPLVFRCADGVYIHLVIGGAGSKYKMYQALEIDDPTVKPDDSGMPQPTDDPKNFFGNIDLLAEHAAKKTSTELLQRIWERGLPAEPILPPGGNWDSDQVKHNQVVVADADGTRHVGFPFMAEPSPAPRKPAGAAGEQPLSGVRAVDFGAFVAGPYASIILADLGSEVVKVEAPAGDPNRSIFRSYSPVNRGKRAITVDMKNPEGIKLAQELCLSGDVVTSNFRTGVSSRLGIDPNTLHENKPELIVLESPGYGSKGPLAERAAFDMVMQALCGHEYCAGGAGNEPLWNRTSMVDYTGGLIGALACLTGLYHRAHTGEGVTLDSPLMNAGMYLVSDVIQLANGEFRGDAIFNAERTGFHPAEALYEAKDGWLAVVVRTAAQAEGLASALALDGLNPVFSVWGEAEQKRIGAAIAARAKDDVIAALGGAGVWVEECRQNTENEVLSDSSLVEKGVVQVSSHPQYGTVREIGAMMRFSRSKVGHNRYAPLKGENTRELLAGLGKSAEEIDRLFDASVVS